MKPKINTKFREIKDAKFLETKLTKVLRTYKAGMLKKSSLE